MYLEFSKYHGTGNDFIMVDGRDQDTSLLDQEIIHRLCHRRFGIGADGLIILEESRDLDFYMRYYNADGREGSMCGNGGRCIVAFARALGISGDESRFEGIDGTHEASTLADGNIRLKLIDVEGIDTFKDGYFTNTGSPHFVMIVSDLENRDVALEGKNIRHQERFGPGGTNVNFVEFGEEAGSISVRTFERGVEAETWSCGTGVSAAAICAHFHQKTDIFSYSIQTLGGKLRVDFTKPAKDKFTEIHLTGPATSVFSGTLDLSQLRTENQELRTKN